MNDEHERFAEWDAAYVLGALSPADRAAFEAHASDCAVCREAMADLAPVPGLLARVPRTEAIELLSVDEAVGSPTTDPARARIVELGVARSRRTRRTRWMLASAAAAAVIVGIVAVPAVLSQQPAPGETIALALVEDVPLDATVRLENAAWGTRLSLTCSYGYSPDAPEAGWEYALVVVSTSGAESQLSTWRAFPDTTAHLDAGTALRSDDIAAIELRAQSGAVLMRSEPNG